MNSTCDEVILLSGKLHEYACENGFYVWQFYNLRFTCHFLPARCESQTDCNCYSITKLCSEEITHCNHHLINHMKYAVLLVTKPATPISFLTIAQRTIVNYLPTTHNVSCAQNRQPVFKEICCLTIFLLH